MSNPIFFVDDDSVCNSLNTNNSYFPGVMTSLGYHVTTQKIRRR